MPTNLPKRKRSEEEETVSVSTTFRAVDLWATAVIAAAGFWILTLVEFPSIDPEAIPGLRAICLLFFSIAGLVAVSELKRLLRD